MRASTTEVSATLPGDDIVPDANVVMDRAFDLPAPPEDVWPWFAQLGKNRSGWYLPRAVERLIPPRRRALRRLDGSLQHLKPGDIIDDWGGRDATFEIVTHEPPDTLVHRSTRGAMRLSWAITLRPSDGGTRVHLRLRLAGVRRVRLAEYGGGLVDLLTVAGLAAGLRERLGTTWPWLRAEIVSVTAKVDDLLRAMPGDLPLARVTWSAAETGAHLVSLPRRYRRMINEPRPMPVALSEENERELAAISERNPGVLADLLEAEVAELLTVLDGRQTGWYFTVRHTAAGLGALVLAELLVHGLDLARAVGRPWPVTRAQAAACLEGILPVIVLLVDPAAAGDGTYHLRVRGHHDWTIRVADGAAEVERGRPASADLHFSVEPRTFLLSSYGHVSDLRALLAGGLVAWGRKPWLVTRFAATFRET